jgi:hypothetical protein
MKQGKQESPALRVFLLREQVVSSHQSAQQGHRSRKPHRNA